VRAGQLNTWVTIESRSDTRAADGGLIEGWSAVDSTWASVVDLRGREYLAAKEAHADVSTRVWIRWRDDVTTTMRVHIPAGRVRERTLSIEAVIDTDGRGRMLELMCREVVA
jgi:SPP1 family predicted phage head-tail adaptor